MARAKGNPLPSHASRNALRESIRSAFPDGSLPTRIVRSDPDGDAELGAIVKAFAAKRWTELDADMVDRHYDALSFFSPEAFRYYLPAYMLGCMAGGEAR